MRLRLRYEKRHILAESVIGDEVSVGQGLVGHWRNWLDEDCLLDRVTLVSVAGAPWVAAVAGLDAHKAVAVVMLAAEQRLQFHAFHAVGQVEQIAVDFFEQVSRPRINSNF